MSKDKQGDCHPTYLITTHFNPHYHTLQPSLPGFRRNPGVISLIGAVSIQGIALESEIQAMTCVEEGYLLNRSGYQSWGSPTLITVIAHSLQSLPGLSACSTVMLLVISCNKDVGIVPTQILRVSMR